MLLAAYLGGYVARKAGQPPVLGELLAGAAMGSASLFGTSWFEPLKTNTIIGALAQLGVILLLFEAGLETTVAQMLHVGAASFRVAMLGVVGPLLLGWGVGAWLLPDSGVYVHIFLGATLTATSVGITARVLKDLGRANSLEARIILGASVIDDVLGLLILTFVVAFIGATAASGAIPGAAVGMVVFKASAPTVGAFAAGLLLDRRRIHKYIRPAAAIADPDLFVLMGLRTDITVFAQPGVVGFAAALTLAAIAGKQVCGFGVLRKSADRLSIGIGMIPRGEVGLIFRQHRRLPDHRGPARCRSACVLSGGRDGDRHNRRHAAGAAMELGARSSNKIATRVTSSYIFVGASRSTRRPADGGIESGARLSLSALLIYLQKCSHTAPVIPRCVVGTPRCRMPATSIIRSFINKIAQNSVSCLGARYWRSSCNLADAGAIALPAFI